MPQVVPEDPFYTLRSDPSAATQMWKGEILLEWALSAHP